jgi:hypothetical protein
VLAAYDGMKERQLPIVMALVDQRLSQITDDSLEEAQKNPKKPHPLREKIRLLEEFQEAPSHRKVAILKRLESLATPEGVRKLPNLSPITARGIFKALNARMINDTWDSFAEHVQELSAVAKR